MNKKAVSALCIYVGVMVGGMLILKVVVRTVEGPDFRKSARMRALRNVQMLAYSHAAWWGTLGMKAENQYNKCKL